MQGAFQGLNAYLDEMEQAAGHTKSNRVFYLALPPVVFGSVAQLLKAHTWSSVR